MRAALILRAASQVEAAELLAAVRDDGWDARPVRDEGTGAWLIEVPVKDEQHGDVVRAKLSLVVPPNVRWETIRSAADRLRDRSE